MSLPRNPALDWSDAQKTISQIDRDNEFVMVPTFRGFLNAPTA
jgi:hypothetical protein